MTPRQKTGINCPTPLFSKGRQGGFSDERGMALVIALLFLAVLTLLGATAAMVSTTDTKISTNYQTSQQAFYAAEAGIERFKTELRGNSDWTTTKNGSAWGNPAIPTTLLGNNSSYTVRVLTSPAATENTIVVRSVGTLSNSTVTIEARFRKGAFDKVLIAGGDIDLGKHPGS